MAEIPKDGGPAFPQTAADRIRDFMGVGMGMSLRDYFAAKAMQAQIPTASQIKDTANQAYEWADAMLEARAK